MLNRESFSARLDITVVPQNLSVEQKEVIYNGLQNESYKILPDKLYRYRSCSENNISSFSNDELWVAKTSLMNDGFDTRPYIDMEEAHESIRQLWQSVLDLEYIEQMLSTEGLPPLFETMKQYLKAISTDELYQMLIQVHDYVVNEMIVASAYIPHITQESIKIGCFSEELCSPYMWGQYADNESGFALEYNFRESPCVEPLFQGKPRTGYIFPVIYGNCRYKIPSDYVLYLLKHRILNQALGKTGLWNSNVNLAQALVLSNVCPDETVATKIALYKSDLWKQEAEWRLFVTGNDVDFQNKNAGCCNKRPTAVYLGRRISPLNEKIIRMLAKEKGLPVYKMHLDDASPSYDLIVGERLHS